MTPNKEDYLKQIYTLGGAENLVGNKQIAAALKISPASVTEMLGKLRREGLIHYEPYKGSRLTEQGLEVSISLLRGHRLWEVFLIECLDYTWSEAHEDAELLEHITPPRLLERLDSFLHHPAYCPHGSAIPSINGIMKAPCRETLSGLQQGQSARICRFEEEKGLLDYLQASGLQIGQRVLVRTVGEYEGPLYLTWDQTHAQISHKAAEQVYVEDIREEPVP